MHLHRRDMNINMIVIWFLPLSNVKQSFKVESGNILHPVTMFVLNLIKINLYKYSNIYRITDEFEQNRILTMLNDIE